MYACEQVTRKGKMLDFLLLFFFSVCVCVWKEERERKTENGTGIKKMYMSTR